MQIRRHSTLSSAIVWCMLLISAFRITGVHPDPARAGGAAFLVKDITAPGVTATPRTLTPVNNKLYFYHAISNGLGGITNELWESDGTEAGTRKADFGPTVVNPTIPVALGDKLLILASGSSSLPSLFAYDGTSTITLRETFMFSRWIGVYNGSYYYIAMGDPIFGTQLCRTDGTLAGTTCLKYMYAVGSSGSGVSSVVLDGRLIFTTGAGLWTTDGTAAGTAQINAPVAPTELALLGNKVYFDNGAELWVTDGTHTGTTLVKSFFPPALQIRLQAITVVNGRVIFKLVPQLALASLWSSDGTDAGTVQLRAEVLGKPVATISGQAAYVISNAQSGLRLFRTDGTTQGTTQAGDVGVDSLGGLVAVGEAAIFIGFTAAEGSEAWISDGTAEGTQLLADVNPGSASSSSAAFTLAGDFVFFTADDGAHGYELWAIPHTLFEPAPAYGAYLPLIRAP